MVRKTMRKMKRWIGRVVLGQNRLGQLTKAELDNRIWKVEEQRDEFKKEMDSLKAEFNSVVEEAKHASEDEVKELKTTASTVLSKYKAKRYMWSKTHAGLNMLEQARLNKDIQQVSVSGLPPETDPVAISKMTNEWEETIQSDKEKVAGMERASSQMEGIHDGGAAMLDQNDNGPASDIIDAAREGESVPTIDELADEAYDQPSQNETTNEDDVAAGMSNFPGE